MGPVEYEHLVAETLQSEGWQATVTPPTNDFGVDVIAERDGIRLAVQAKMYGGSARRVNPATVMELYGAAAYATCDEALIATDGELMPKASKVAEALGIQVRHIPREGSGTQSARSDAIDSAGDTRFDSIWNEQVKSLEGKTLIAASGRTNSVERVDDSGLVRVSSNGKRQFIGIEIFRWTIEKLLAGNSVTRAEINDRYPKRASSGIVLVLSSVPSFQITKVGGQMALEIAPDERAGLSEKDSR